VSIETWTAGAEHDQTARTRLRVAIESLGYTPKTQWWGVGGSQEITHVELVGPAGQIEVDAETYIGLTVKGDSNAIAAIRKAMESGIGQQPQPVDHMNSVFVLQHLHSPTPDSEEVKLIGVYRSREAAEGAVARLRDQQGFRSFPHIVEAGSESDQGFHITEQVLDRDGWVSGFISWAEAFEGK